MMINPHEKEWRDTLKLNRIYCAKNLALECVNIIVLKKVLFSSLVVMSQHFVLLFCYVSDNLLQITLSEKKEDLL